MSRPSSNAGSAESLERSESNDSKDSLFRHLPGDYRYSFGSLLRSTNLQKVAIFSGVVGGLLILLGIIYAIFGISGYTGLILILLGALAMVITVIIAERTCFKVEPDNTSLSSVNVSDMDVFERVRSTSEDAASCSDNVFETSVQVHMNREVQLPLSYYSSTGDQRREQGHSYRFSTFFKDDSDSTYPDSSYRDSSPRGAAGVSPVVQSPSAPPLEKKAREDPPSYDELFSKRI